MQSFHNPFDRPDSLQLGINDQGYFVVSRSIHCHVHMQFGPLPSTVALVMKANGVRHFDYHDSLFNDPAATARFLDVAYSVGFAA